MARYKDGELIVLHWEDYPGYEIIKGHVDLEEAAKAVANEYGQQALKDAQSAEHAYGRWGVCINYEGERGQSLFEHDEPGRGIFKITRVAMPCNPANEYL